MILDEVTLIELGDYIEELDTQIGLSSETLIEVHNAISKAIKKARDKNKKTDE
jgi:hypothetical protein